MNKTSIFLQSQLPSFIRDDDNYQNFVLFLEAYYEWMEEKKGVVYESDKLLEYSDIDSTLDEYVDYFYNVFMPSFPKEVLADRRRLIRFSKELYESKGNVASFKFLFKVLYNSDPEIIETKEFVLKPSSGKWFIPRSVKIKSNDSSWINAEGLWIFGETSKSLAKIERAKLVNSRIEVFISDIERLFQTGEDVIVVDRNLRTILFDPDGQITTDSTEGNILSAKILGSISNILINPDYRGNYYLAGDPVAVYGGMEDGIGAEAEVGEVTLGSIQRVRVDNGSWGYRTNPNTFIYVTPDSGRPIITVETVNPANLINVTVVQDSLELKKDIELNCNVQTGFPHSFAGSNSYCFYASNANSIISNANTVMAEALTFKTYETYSIDALTVQNGGGGFRSIPTISAESVYSTDLPISVYDNKDVRYYSGKAYDVTSIKNFGILGPILFRSNTAGYPIRGTAYEVGDELIFSGGLGGGAKANVVSVVGGGSFGPIQSIAYYQDTENALTKGGYGYTTKELPIISIKPKTRTGNTTQGSSILKLSYANLANITLGQTVSGNGIPKGTTVLSLIPGNTSVYISNTATGTYISNTYNFSGNGAQLYVSTVLGDSAQFVPITDRIGSITTIKVTNYGEDYVTSPSVSLKVQDIAVTGLSLLNIPEKEDILYQGNSVENATYKSTVQNVTRLTFDANPILSTFIIRVYGYTKIPNVNLPLILWKKNSSLTPNTFNVFIKTDYVYPEKTLPDNSVVSLGKDGILSYGDGSAKANSQFLQGLVLGQGRYIDESHHPSSFSLIQSEDYNNFTYLISVEREISKYREILYQVLHPAGTKPRGQAVLKSQNNINLNEQESTVTRELIEYDYFWAALATEESDENDYVSELIRFTESNTKYGYVSSNNSSIVTLTTLPDYIMPDKNIFGNGLPNKTKILEVYVGNNTIRLSNNSTITQNNKEFLIRDYWSGNNINYVAVNKRFYANTVNNSNLMTIYTKANTVQGIVKNQIIVANNISIFANTVNNSNLLKNVESVSKIVVGHHVKGNNIPHGTRVSAIFTGNNTIQLTKNATGTSNGVNYAYYDKNSGNYISQYKYDYVQFTGLPYNTRVKDIIYANSSIVLSNTYIKSTFDDVFYFLGDGSSRDSEIVSSFVRVESGSLVERDGTESITPNSEKYFSYDDFSEASDITENTGQLLTEDGVPLISTIYIKTK
jgi:hypothetical protein